MVEVYLSKGADHSGPGGNNLVRSNSKTIVKLLVKYKANTKCTDNNGDTPLHLASIARDKYLIKMLLPYFISELIVVNNQWNTPLHIIATLKDHKLYRLLTEK